MAFIIQFRINNHQSYKKLKQNLKRCFLANILSNQKN